MDLGPVLSELGAFIRDQRTGAQISLRALASKAGVSNPYLSQVERGLRRPSADILVQIARGLSISVESLLAKAGILDGTVAPDVVTAIRADDLLGQRQKSSMIDIYLAFRAQAETSGFGSGTVGAEASGIPAGRDLDQAAPELSEKSTVADISA